MLSCLSVVVGPQASTTTSTINKEVVWAQGKQLICVEVVGPRPDAFVLLFGQLDSYLYIGREKDEIVFKSGLAPKNIDSNQTRLFSV